MDAPASSKNYAALDGIRGYAVILVSLTHFTGLYVAAYRGFSLERVTYASLDTPTDRLYLWLFLGQQSLYILLTISGYMVCRMVVRPSYAGYLRFILARGARIYPPLLFGLLFALLGYALIGKLENVNLSLRNILYNVLTLNGIFELKGQPYAFPSWSLFYETIFCLFIPVLVSLSRKTKHPIVYLFTLWVPILGFLAIVGFSGWILFSPFLAGSLLAQLDDRRLVAIAERIPTWTVILAYAVVATLPSSWAPFPVLDNHGLHFAPSYMVFIVLACLMSCALLVKSVFSPGPLQRVFAIRPLNFLGKISYSFYMLHATLIFLTFAWFAPRIGQWSKAGEVSHFFPLLALFWLMSFAAAVVGYYAVEMLYFRSALSSRSKAYALAHASDSAAPAVSGQRVT
jgi:peptidoglycan/LPS O-acetylase OafA/YrhL